jgi:hypothetical protein
MARTQLPVEALTGAATPIHRPERRDEPFRPVRLAGRRCKRNTLTNPRVEEVVEIGEPERTYTVEPLEDPVPRERPSEPAESPAPPTPAEEPAEPERVPAR